MRKRQGARKRIKARHCGRDSFLDCERTAVLRRFAGTSGAEIWRHTLNGSANDEESAYAVAVDAAGDVVAVGDTMDAANGRDFTVVKLAGGTGAELWRYDIAEPSPARAQCVAIDSAGDVLVGGAAAPVISSAARYAATERGASWRETRRRRNAARDARARDRAAPSRRDDDLGTVSESGPVADSKSLRVWDQEV
jgi:hypothetical protein